MTQTTLASIKDNVEKCIGHKVRLRTNKSRKKISVKEGIVENIYPSIFVVRIEDSLGLGSTRTVSYSYIDLLTNAVEMTLCDDQNTKIS